MIYSSPSSCPLSPFLKLPSDPQAPVWCSVSYLATKIQVFEKNACKNASTHIKHQYN